MVAYLIGSPHAVGVQVTYIAYVYGSPHMVHPPLEVELTLDPLLTIESSSVDFIQLGPGHLRWAVPSIPPGGIQGFTFTCLIPEDEALTGQVVTAALTLFQDEPDTNEENDHYAITRTILNSLDPNDKLVRTSTGHSEGSYILGSDEYVDYTIRFQNTGTTAAVNVYLIDTLAPEFDLNSLWVITASHSFSVEVLPGRVLRYDFQNIMLPDSSSDPLGSQGFASFRIWPAPGLEPGMLLRNAADIYFDFNEPIRTNDADLIVALPTTIGAAQDDPRVLVHPNPASELLRVMLPDGQWFPEVLSTTGELVMSFASMASHGVLDVSQLAEGMYILRVNNGQGGMATTRFVRH